MTTSTDTSHAQPYVDVTVELPPVPTSPTAAREAVASAAMAHARGEVVADAELLVTELVTNAILHARSAVTVRVHVDGVLRVEVSDGDPTPLPCPALPDDPDATGGRGLVLVDAMSAKWGWEVNATGKRVWFELDPDGA